MGKCRAAMTTICSSRMLSEKGSIGINLFPDERLIYNLSKIDKIASIKTEGFKKGQQVG